MADKYLDNIVLNRGNQGRIKGAMEKAGRGERITIGYLGGSITRGSVASTPEKCYAYLSHLWWKEQFPQTQVVYCNAGIGATTSQFGVARSEEDLLYCDPDVVFVEFSVNDECDEHFQETYEGLLRKILQWRSSPAVVLLHNSFFDSGRSAVEIHSAVGKYYDLPSVSIKSNLYDRIRDGVLKAEDITSDYLHPNDLGHQMLAETVKYFLDMVYKEVENKEEKYVFPQSPMTANRYENSKRLQKDTLVVEENIGFKKDLSPQADMSDVFKNGFLATEEGARLKFSFVGKTLSVQYRRTIQKPAPKARVIVDGRKEKTVILDGEFDENWGDLIALTTIFEEEQEEKHLVEIEVFDTTKEDKSGFYLVSVIQS